MQKNITQEQLAEYLNISSQAVSKWETNISLPDITLIPMLANIFNVTTDMLLGVDIEAKEKQVEATVQEAQNHIFRKRHEEAEKLLRTALKEYLNRNILMDNLAECTDDFIKHSSIQRLCSIYAIYGRN
jgi:transcriptional regulator with XRE-family HTH domain